MPIVFQKSIFYHVPKTGGTYVSYWLQPFTNRIGLAHDTPSEMKPHRACRNPEAMDVIHCVRHPADWLTSLWRYCTDENGNWRRLNPAILQPIIKCGAKTFDGFIENYLEYCPGYVGDLYAHYSDSPNPVHVAKQEYLDDDLRAIVREVEGIELPAATTPRNVSRIPKPSWDSFLYAKVLDAEAITMNAYNY